MVISGCNNGRRYQWPNIQRENQSRYAPLLVGCPRGWPNIQAPRPMKQLAMSCHKHPGYSCGYNSKAVMAEEWRRRFEKKLIFGLA